MQREIDELRKNGIIEKGAELNFIIAGKKITNLEINELSTVNRIIIEADGKTIKHITALNEKVRTFIKNNSKGYKEIVLTVNKELTAYIDDYLKGYFSRYSKNLFKCLVQGLKESFIPDQIYSKGFIEYFKSVYASAEGNFVTTFLGHLGYSTSKSLTKEFVKNFIDNYKEYAGIAINELKKGNYIGTFLIDLPFITYNLLNYQVEYIKEIVSSIENSDLDIEDKKNLIILKKALEELLKSKVKSKIFLLEDRLNIEHKGFRVIVLKKEETQDLVICFSNPKEGTEVRNNIKEGNILGETALMTLVDSLVLGKIIENLLEKDKEIENYKITITGFGYGADLAELYFTAQEYLEMTGFKNKDIRTFKYSYNSLIKSLYEFEPRDIAMFYNVTANSVWQVLCNELSINNKADKTFIVLTTLIDIGFNGFTFFYGSVVLKILLNASRWANEIKNDAVINDLYVELCKNKIFNCSNYHNCLNKNFKNCKRLNKDVYSHTTDINIKQTQEIKRILKDNTKIYSITLKNENYSGDIYGQTSFFILENINLSLEDYIELKIELDLKKEFGYDFLITKFEKIYNGDNFLYKSRELKSEEKFKEINNKFVLKKEIRENPKILEYFKEREKFLLTNGKNTSYIDYGPLMEKTVKNFYYEISLKENRYFLEKYMAGEKVYFNVVKTVNTQSNYPPLKTTNNDFYALEEKPIIIEKDINRFISFLEMNREQKEAVEKLLEYKTYYLLGE